MALVRWRERIIRARVAFEVASATALAIWSSRICEGSALEALAERGSRLVAEREAVSETRCSQ